MKIIECVPNISEGRDKTIINAVTGEVSQITGATLLDVDPGEATNRTVITIAGTPEAVEEAAFQVVKKASELIDMSNHQGEHPRMGATDVCPFVPVQDVTMDECIEIARRVGKRIGEELEIPVYLYENAASRPERINLADVRTGEYEALPEKHQKPEWEPDFGPHQFNPKSGATAVSARQFLIAYNINLNTASKAAAHDIALDIREKGRLARDENGKVMKDADGKKLRKEGLFKHCKAVGWYIEEYNRAQISINLTDFTVTPPHLVLEEVRRLAEKKGLIVTGSEIVGLVPLEAMLQAGRYYLKKQGLSTAAPDPELIRIACLSMGLSDVSTFDPADKIIEFRTGQGRLASMSLVDFADELSSDSPAPGGGSVAALCGSLSAALSAMVANLSFGKKGYEEQQDELINLAEEAQILKKWFNSAIDQDTLAFEEVMKAMKMPKKKPELAAARNAAIQEATKLACDVPLSVLAKTERIAELSLIMAEKGNQNSLSDSGVAALMAETAATAAWYNVLINVQGIEDNSYVSETRTKADSILASTRSMVEKTGVLVKERLLSA